MSLQYVIDGYNLINHPIFARQANKKNKDRREVFLEYIRLKELAGSRRNKVTVVFDGYPDTRGIAGAQDERISVIFSREATADKRIMDIVQNYPDPRNIAVVSDDKEIIFFCRACGAKVKSAEEFLVGKKRDLSRRDKGDSSEPEISYSQMHEINKELRKIWL